MELCDDSEGWNGRVLTRHKWEGIYVFVLLIHFTVTTETNITLYYSKATILQFKTKNTK